ncbi:MAG TPA: recombinase family protein [Coleofasciculaceae cyanobacterium]
MVIYAYLRVSTNQQDVDNQRHGILEYANQKSLGHLEFVADSVSGQKRWRKRELGKLLTKTSQSGDMMIFAGISRMARSTLQVLEILECCMQRGLLVHIAKERMVLDDSMPSRITATVLGLAAEIERELISMRTTEAQAKRRSGGSSSNCTITPVKRNYLVYQLNFLRIRPLKPLKSRYNFLYTC